jgi:hypothetical protein
MPANGLQLGLVPVVRNAKCTNVQRDIKIENEQALAQGAVSGSICRHVLPSNQSFV